MANPYNLTIKQAVQAIKNGVMPIDFLALDCLERIKNSKTNSVVFTDERAVLDNIKNITNFEGRLLGIPVLIKDNIDVMGMPTRCGSDVFDCAPKSRDAECVRRLRAEGAIILGKTNMDEFAMGSSNMTSKQGRVLNPCGKGVVPGGSSGGSAAAVKEGLCFAALGSDTGGSIRQPASYCGVVGLKPSFGSVSSDGCFPLAPSMDMIGPIARSVEDAALIQSVISGTEFGSADPFKLRVGMVTEADRQASGAARTVLDTARNVLESKGMEVGFISIPRFFDAGFIYKTVAFSEIERSLSMVKHNRDRLGGEVKKRIICGKYVQEHSEILQQGLLIRQQLTSSLFAALTQFDVLILPTAPSAAFGFNDSTDLEHIKHSDMYAQPASIAGLPSINVPLCSEDGLPVGVQLVAGLHNEHAIFALGSLLEQA